MDREKVISQVEEEVRLGKHWDESDRTIEMELLENVLLLLKEQEPLEPLMEKIEQAGPLYHRCYCKKCGHHVGNMIKNKVTEAHENFCSSCGQAVKWK